MQAIKISAKEFEAFRRFIYDEAGINLGEGKQTLVASRLGKRLRHYSLEKYQDYFELLTSKNHSHEKQVAIDLLTTNETYFFREPKHFNYLAEKIIATRKTQLPFKIWSAASSSGEEAYSIAMLLDDLLSTSQWSVFGSDISSDMIKIARAGLYTQNRIEGIPLDYLQRYCWKGHEQYEGMLLVDASLRKRVQFSQINLTKSLGDIGPFHVVFLRNVLIYFDIETKNKIIKRIADKMVPGGQLFIGHSESLNAIQHNLINIAPTIYQKP